VNQVQIDVKENGLVRGFSDDVSAPEFIEERKALGVWFLVFGFLHCLALHSKESC
jgi:hypothetical protein